MLEQFRKSLLQELDYRMEATNLTTIREQLRDFSHIIVPAPIANYSTSRVLTMEFVPGKKITDLSPLARMEFDGSVLAEELFRAYLEQILVHGFFHADPHPGNVFITPDHRVALLDLGMVGRILPKLQEDLLQLLLAIAEGHGDEAANIAIKIGEKKEEFASKEFTRRIGEIVAQQKTATVEQMQVGRLVLEVTQVSAENGIRVPPELTMLGKTFSTSTRSAGLLLPSSTPTLPSAATPPISCSSASCAVFPRETSSAACSNCPAHARRHPLPHLGLSGAGDHLLPRRGRRRDRASDQHPFLRQGRPGLTRRRVGRASRPFRHFAGVSRRRTCN